jgi:ribosome modulation factor
VKNNKKNELVEAYKRGYKRGVSDTMDELGGLQ